MNYGGDNRTVNTVNFAKEYLEICKRYRRQLIQEDYKLVVFAISDDSKIDEISFLNLEEKRN